MDSGTPVVTNTYSDPSASVSFDDTIEVERAQETLLAPTIANQRTYRDALGTFGTGVTIITANGSDGPVGMTVNSFASVSLDPALILWSLAKSSGRFAPFNEAEHFAIHILQNDQQALALAFAKDGAAFHACDWNADTNGTPLIADALARFDCTKTANHDAGDHRIIVGQVNTFCACESEPLLFQGGAFGGFHKAR